MLVTWRHDTSNGLTHCDTVCRGHVRHLVVPVEGTFGDCSRRSNSGIELVVGLAGSVGETVVDEIHRGYYSRDGRGASREEQGRILEDLEGAVEDRESGGGRQVEAMMGGGGRGRAGRFRQLAVCNRRQVRGTNLKNIAQLF